VDELPTDAMMTIHCAAISSSDAMPHGTDATELFTIQVDELARILAFIASDRFGGLQGIELIRAQPTQNATDNGRETPTSTAICLPVQRCRRNR
jgi:hypothetical protein